MSKLSLGSWVVKITSREVDTQKTGKGEGRKTEGKVGKWKGNAGSGGYGIEILTELGLLEVTLIISSRSKTFLHHKFAFLQTPAINVVSLQILST